MPVYDVKTEKELNIDEIMKLLQDAINNKKWPVAMYYTRLLAREIANQARGARAV